MRGVVGYTTDRPRISAVWLRVHDGCIVVGYSKIWLLSDGGWALGLVLTS